MPEILYAGQPDNVKRILEKLEWGYATINNVTFLFCPWCQAMIPSYFNNAHKPGVTTPKAVHIEYHEAVAYAIQGARNAS